MAAHLYAFVRAPDADVAGPCPHCRETLNFEAFRLQGASALGRLFAAMSPKTPVLRCPRCERLSQRLGGFSRLLVALSWAPMALMLAGLAAYVGAHDGDPTLLWACAAGAAAVTAYMAFRVFSKPFYPIAGRALLHDGNLVWGR